MAIPPSTKLLGILAINVMNHGIKYILAIIAIVLGLIAIMKIVRQADLIAGIISLTFGIMAVIWVYRARRTLSPGSSLREYSTYFLFCLLFIIAFSISLTAERFFIKTSTPTFLVYLEYALLTLAYLTFVATAYKIWSIGQEFGFEKESEEIRKAIKKKKR